MNYVQQDWGEPVDRYIAEPGPWVGCSINHSTFAWPTIATSALFRGAKVVLRPATDRLAATLAVKRAPFASTEAAMVFLSRFMTSLAWSTSSPIRAEMWMESGHFPGFGVVKGSRAQMIQTGPLHIRYLPDPTDPRAWLALALFREGSTLDHAGYSFMSYYKILNILFPDGPQQVRWINTMIPLLREHDVVERVAELAAANPDVGNYLYHSGRNAMAHAWQQPIVDPDEIADERRLYRALPVMIALAAHAIEHEFGVKKFSTIFTEHLYELQGFKEILPPDLVQVMLQSGSVPRRQLPDIPSLTLRLWGSEKFPALEAMSTTATAAHDGRLQISAMSPGGAITVTLVLDFPSERLALDPVNGVQCVDSGTAVAANEIADALRFQDEMLGNGELEVWLGDGSSVLGWKDAYLPMNMWPDVKANRENIAHWKELAKARAAT